MRLRSVDLTRVTTKALLLILTVVLLLVFCACTPKDPIENLYLPTSDDFWLIVPAEWELSIGDSRSVDYSFDESVSARKLTWEVLPSDIATVDEWGRVTAVSCGYASVVATAPNGEKSSAVLHVVDTPTKYDNSISKRDYQGNAVALGDNLQKIVTKYSNEQAIESVGVPDEIKRIISERNFDGMQSVKETNGTEWKITEYGVLRVDENARIERDREQRFMGDRYFYSADSTDGKVLCIIGDGKSGIWAFMEDGITHIEMKAISGAQKAEMMVEDTQAYVMRRGMVSDSHFDVASESWIRHESDNDGLWTSMYAGGELMRYASLKASGVVGDELEKARSSAMLSTEAVLLLSNICMRTGTTDAYVRYQPNANYDFNAKDGSLSTDSDDVPINGRFLSDEALIHGGDNSLRLPSISPSAMYEKVWEEYNEDGTLTLYVFDEEYMFPYDMDSWSDPRTVDGEYAKRTRNLEGYVARTYSFKDEGIEPTGYIHWSLNGDGTATGVSKRGITESHYYLNGENNRGKVVDASGEIPSRLWNDVLAGTGKSVEDIVYKGDTSSDEIIGHLFLYKLAYDVLGSEDAELKQIIVNTVERLAKHVSDNSYMMVDGSGQPGTWSKFNREFFYNSSQLGGAPLTSSVVLCLFKLASYVTGNQKWENEYRMAALDPSYEYAKLVAQYDMQCQLMMVKLLKDYVGEDLAVFILGSLTDESKELLFRLFLNYSDEEMAMLAFYLLFQMETDETLLGYYRDAIDDWWVSIKYSENPLWYYIYQLAYPDREIKDAYGNEILATAAWSLSRHVVDTHKYSASNVKRDDLAELSLRNFGIGDGAVLTMSLDGTDKKIIDLTRKGGDILDALDILGGAQNIEWAVGAPDERSFHKYNGESTDLNGHHQPYEREGSTTYTLPYWMGIYHGMLKEA